MSSDITFSFTPSEIILPGTVLELTLRSPVSADTAHKSITVSQDTKPVDVKIAVEGTVVRIPTQDFPPGPYFVSINDLKDTEGRALKGPAVAHYVVVTALRGAIPSEYKIHSVVHLVFEEFQTTRLSPGSSPPAGADYVELVKTSHRQTQALKQFAFDADGRDVDADKKFKVLDDRKFAKYGKLNESLYNVIDRKDDKEVLDVLIYPVIDFDLTGHIKPTDVDITEQPQAERDSLDKIGIAHIRAIERVGGKPEETSSSRLVISASLTCAQIRQLKDSPDVGLILHNNFEGPLLLGNSMNISRATAMWTAPNLPVKAQGIKVAVWENGPDNHNGLQIAAAYKTPANVTDWHSRLVHAIIKNKQPGLPNGYAPDCSLLSANSPNADALDWAINTQKCNVLNMSFRLTKEPDEGSLSSADQILDKDALLFPFPVIVRGCGNLTTESPVVPLENQFVASKGFNVISTGNHDDSASDINATGSTFRNPPSQHGDRELPHLCANGETVAAVGLNASGTSFATPAVSGTAALLQRTHITLKSWPVAVRAILMASTTYDVPRQPALGASGWRSWYVDIVTGKDQRDGAGALDVESAWNVATSPIQTSSITTAKERGWYVGNIDVKTIDRSTGNTPFKFFMKSRTFPPPRFNVFKFKCVLVWESKIIADSNGVTSSTLAADLDLHAVDRKTGAQWGISASYDNSHEIMEFWGNIDAEYEVSIKASSVLPNVDNIRFGIAWQTFESD